MLTRLVDWLAVTGGQGPHLVQNCLCLRGGYAVTGVGWCPIPHPDMTNLLLSVFNRKPRKRLWGLPRGRVGESLHGPQPSRQQAMWPSQCRPTLQISGTKSAESTLQGPHCSPPLSDPWKACRPVPYAQLFTAGCCPVASPWRPLLTPSPLSQSLPQHADQGQHPRQGAGLESAP